MRKLGRASIQTIINRARKEFMSDDSAPDLISFFYKDHYVEAWFGWSSSRCTYFITEIIVRYSRCTMIYKVGEDYDLSSALCEY